MGKFTCEGCGKDIRSPERYGYGPEDGGTFLRLCEDCCRAKGYLQRKKNEKGREEETFLF